MRSNLAVGWSFPCNAADKCKILTFSFQKNKRLNFDSGSIQLTQPWLKWRWTWFDSDSTHNLDFHGRLNSDSTHLSQSRIKFDSRLMSRAQPCSAVSVTRELMSYCRVFFFQPGSSKPHRRAHPSLVRPDAALSRRACPIPFDPAPGHPAVTAVAAFDLKIGPVLNILGDHGGLKRPQRSRVI